MVTFDVSAEDRVLIDQIATRVIAAWPRLNKTEVAMDVTAVHANGCPLDLDALLKAEVLEFLDDMARIRGGIDRSTGTLSPTTELRFTLEARNADRR